MLKDMAVQRKVAEVRRLTQEELLEEAKITEELNAQSLGMCLTFLLGLLWELNIVTTICNID